MAWIVDEKNGRIVGGEAKLINYKDLSTIKSDLAWKILKYLSNSPGYPKDIAEKLKVNEQKIYYHIRNLERSGIISVIAERKIKGAFAKVYRLNYSVFSLVVKDLSEVSKFLPIKEKHKKFFEPFIQDGKLNSMIVVGSPESHGITKSRAKDLPDAVKLSLFLGSFLNQPPKNCVKIDTEVKSEDLKNNLILIGGPAVNNVVKLVNDKMPIRLIQTKYERVYFSSIFSELSKKNYVDEECGIIVKTKNPFDKSKSILVLAGRRSFGTKAAVLAILNNLDEICKGNSYNENCIAKVVEGIDADSDGIIDSVEFLE